MTFAGNYQDFRPWRAALVYFFSSAGRGRISYHRCLQCRDVWVCGYTRFLVVEISGLRKCTELIQRPKEVEESLEVRGQFRTVRVELYDCGILIPTKGVVMIGTLF